MAYARTFQSLPDLLGGKEHEPRPKEESSMGEAGERHKIRMEKILKKASVCDKYVGIWQRFDQEI